MTKETCYSFCSSCDRNTFHKIIHDHSYGDEDSLMEYKHQIIECLGCKNCSFRYVEISIEDYYEDAYGNRHYYETTDIYPKKIKLIKGVNYLPSIIRDVYEETLLAIGNKAYILAGLGLRTTLEAICNDKNIKGSSLEEKIDHMSQESLLTQRDANLLHSIRFLGNNAAHYTIKANHFQINAALEIIEYLIKSLYILEKQVAGKLDLPIDNYDDFVKKLLKVIKRLPDGYEFNIPEILEDSRLIKGNLKKQFFKKFRDEVSNEKIDNLSLSSNPDKPIKIVRPSEKPIKP
ncbi:Uncharacterised protein [Neisseria zoodegmatis]|uniref:DUF4145 domain-containing protein n=1 Tax=Neisseria zoodegmatis TaxID=326523 RepID=A0A378WIX0_9NEIS|nr:DUF4145 domain-containing protein [Neisseria zoodegmatis]SUA36665.1 Uncharacterised protein [Neisseria zoodegmatis]